MNLTHSKLYIVLALALLAATSALGQDAKLKVQADPPNAFVFVDGEPYKQHDGALEITPGPHSIGIYSYGFTPFIKKVTLNAGENPVITAKLEPLEGQVDGPWGNLQIKGINSDYLVFLNGRAPDFFVGRVSEARGNHLAVPPGTQHVIIVKPEGNQEMFAGYVKIMPNKRAILHADRNETWYEAWADGAQLHAQPRYTANTLAIAPVRASLRSLPVAANCGQPVHLVWTAADGFSTMMKQDGVAIGNGLGVGEQIVNPKQTTTYYLETFGPGGVTMIPYTVEVNKAVKASLTVTPASLRYHKVGDKVLEQGSATLNWSASNAETVQVDPIGTVPASGEQTIALIPTKTDVGTVNETRVYRITASNTCGGTDTTTAMVEIAGSIDPAEPPVVVASAEPLPPVLPQTGSPLPLIGLLGFVSLSSGLVLRRFSKKK
ncbi:MAG TPA: PEGA domain-containing protein [Candidatus Angelobacter sp.]|nr:PEGA domain-containing protein [Candidatus Angelobacter sp.]